MAADPKRSEGFVAKVMFARLCRGIKKDQQTGLYSLVGSFTQLRLSNGPVGFACVVYWKRGKETFRQSFVLRDEAGNILDATPAIEFVLTREGQNISTALFYASFPQAGQYSIDVYQNGTSVENIPFKVVEAYQGLKRPLAPLGPAVQI